DDGPGGVSARGTRSVDAVGLAGWEHGQGGHQGRGGDVLHHGWNSQKLTGARHDRGDMAGRGRRSVDQRRNSPRSRPLAPSPAASLPASRADGAPMPDGISIAVDLLRTRTLQPSGSVMVRTLP